MSREYPKRTVVVEYEYELPPAFERDPDGLCRMVGKALNALLAGDSRMNGWQWWIDWHNLPGAISVSVAGTACAAEEWQCPEFFAATSIAGYDEVDDAAMRLQERIHKALTGWSKLADQQ